MFMNLVINNEIFLTILQNRTSLIFIILAALLVSKLN